MRLEHVPLILGALIAILGLALLADALIPDETLVFTERRRRKRAERHRGGEAAVGIGTLALAAALIGRDTWRYGTLAILIGSVLLAVGGVLNWRFLRELLVFRGPARRAPAGEQPVAAQPVRDADRKRRPNVTFSGDADRSAESLEPSRPSTDLPGDAGRAAESPELRPDPDIGDLSGSPDVSRSPDRPDRPDGSPERRETPRNRPRIR